MNDVNQSLEPTAGFDRDELVLGWRTYTGAPAEVTSLIKYSGRTDMGQVRENNEDKFDVYEPTDPVILAQRGSLYAVADGMGGALAGQIASEMLLKNLILGYYNSPLEHAEHAMEEAIAEANSRIHTLAQMVPERRGMGTTLVALAVVENRVLVVHVGDSRAYLVRDGEISQITTDHSWVEEQVSLGAMSRSDAELSPFRNVITRSVGASATVIPDMQWCNSQVGDTWVLCSDGLTGHVADQEIAHIVQHETPSEVTRQLIHLANARGGRDNITVMVVSIEGFTSHATPQVPAVESSPPVENRQASDDAVQKKGLGRFFGR